MALFAFVMTGGHFGDPDANIVLWGSAAALAAMVVATKGPASIAWVAIGYIVFAGVLAVEPPQLIVASLAFALMPVVPRPRDSLSIGLTITAATALLVRTVLPLLS